MVHSSFPNSLEDATAKAVSLHQNGQLSEANDLYEQILAHAPDHAEVLYYSGVLAAQNQDYDTALERLRHAADKAPQVADIHYNLGVVLKELGRYGDAAEAYRQAIRTNADFPDAHNNLGYVLQCLSRFDEAADAYRRALEIDPNFVAVHVNLALLLKQCGDLEGAAAEFKRAAELDPGNSKLKIDLQETYRKMVPPWHFPMLNDRIRNEAYANAIAAAVTPDDIVLDIGTGSGLLAMMAARAGAKHVYACEMIKPVAATARDIVAANGLADKITIIDKSSTELEIDKDLPERASLLVSEILDITLIGEGVLPSLRHASACLITPQAKMIPMSAVVWGMLVECQDFKSMNTVDQVQGFDLGLFNYFHQSSLSFDLEQNDHRALSAPFEVAAIDFYELPDNEEERKIHITTTDSGVAQAVVAWFDLTLFDDIVFSTQKGERHNHWRQVIFFLDQEMPVKSGQDFTLIGGHTEKKLYFNVP